MFGGVFGVVCQEYHYKQYAQARMAQAKAMASQARGEDLAREQNANSPYAGKYITEGKTDIPHVERKG